MTKLNIIQQVRDQIERAKQNIKLNKLNQNRDVNNIKPN